MVQQSEFLPVKLRSCVRAICKSRAGGKFLLDGECRNTYDQVMEWSIITAIGLTAPFILAWGWVRYLRVRNRSDWRSRASLIGLSAPLLSGAVWAGMLVLAPILAWGYKPGTPPPPLLEHLIAVGAWIPIIGMLVGLAGRPILILAIVPASIGTVLFWYATTLP